jgi:hypothetical protein
VVKSNRAEANGYLASGGYGVAVVYSTTPPTGTNVALGNLTADCNPDFLC